MMFPGLCFAARLSKFIFPVAEVELREGKVPHRNYKTQELGMSKIVLNTINIEYNIVLNTINELKCHPNQGCNCAMPTLQENPGNCCSPDLFQALWTKGWVFVTHWRTWICWVCAKMSLTLQQGAQSHLQAPPVLFPLPWQGLGRAQRAKLHMNDWSSTRKEALNSCLIIPC